MPAQSDVVARRRSAILYVLTYRELDEGIALQNGGARVVHLQTDLREAERF
jgi:hypothetical protein